MKTKMCVLLLASLVTGLALAGGIASRNQASTNGVAAVAEKIPFQAANVFTASNFTAAYFPNRGLWMLQPIEGARLIVQAKECATPNKLPEGAWFVTHHDHAQLQLHAASHVDLIASQSTTLALHDCASGDLVSDQALRVPAIVLNWLREQGGVVNISNR